MNKLPPPSCPVFLAAALAFATAAVPLRAQPAPGARTPPPAGPVNDEVASSRMAPPTTQAIVDAAAAAPTPIAPGPYQPTWESLKANYHLPQWLKDAKFGIFIHWGLYSIPAHHNEWYEQHMYGPDAAWHVAHYGPLDTFGYKDFIPLFTVPKFDPDDWAVLFRQAGARIVLPTAEHHDWFSMWDSAVTPWNAAKMGPKRDIIGELAAAVRRQGMKFGVTNHSMEHYTFIAPVPPGTKTDLNDPAYADFYWVDHSDARLQKFFELWVAKDEELIDKYQPDVLWFDNGVNPRVLDPLKLKVAAYYYNRALQWGKEVVISTKFHAFLAGGITDHERMMRAPVALQDTTWLVHDTIGSTWGYTTGMRIGGAGGFIRTIVDTVSKNGIYLLNVSPTGDGTIPDDQRRVLHEIGGWLQVNGEAIYGTRVWTHAGEGQMQFGRNQAATGKDIRFTAKGDALYAILLGWPGEEAVITSLTPGAASGAVQKVELLGSPGALSFSQGADGLRVKMPPETPNDYAYTLRITGLNLN
jgi:alpha-L-fucosidase